MGEADLVATMPRRDWDRAASSVTRVLERARTVTWGAATSVAVVLVSVGWATTSGRLRWSAVVYGIGLGIAAGYGVRAVYVAARVRRAVKPLRRLLTPDVVDEARTPQVVTLLVNRGAMFDPYLVLRAAVADATVEISKEDLADRDWPRPGFWQLLFTGPDGTYYDDGSGTMDDAAADPSGGLDADLDVDGV